MGTPNRSGPFWDGIEGRAPVPRAAATLGFQFIKADVENGTNTPLSKARLAVVPGYSHYDFVTSTELAPIIEKYLADPLTNPPAGAAAASRSGE